MPATVQNSLAGNAAMPDVCTTIWYPSMTVEFLSLCLADMRAHGDLMRTQHFLAQEVRMTQRTGQE